jgi:hypothetical protein
MSTPNPYTDSPYAHERVGFGLHCEHDPAVWRTIREGDCPKCIHCREEFEHHAEHPQPCIERIAMALEEARGGVVRVGDPVRDPSTGEAVGTVLAAPETTEPAIVTLASGSSIAVAGNGAHEASLPYDEAQAIMDDWKAAHDAEEGE